MKVFDGIRAHVSHLGSMVRGERTSSAGSAGAASAQPDCYASQKPEPPLTPLEKKALRLMGDKVYDDGFMAGFKIVGLKFGAIQGAFLAAGSIGALGLGGALALGAVAALGSAFIMGCLHGGEALSKCRSSLNQVAQTFAALPEQQSMERIKNTLPDIARKLHLS